MSIRSPASDNEIRQWREGYRHHLIEKGIPPAAAWDIAIKIPYRADLYPVPFLTHVGRSAKLRHRFPN